MSTSGVEICQGPCSSCRFLWASSASADFRRSSCPRRILALKGGKNGLSNGVIITNSNGVSSVSSVSSLSSPSSPSSSSSSSPPPPPQPPPPPSNASTFRVYLNFRQTQIVEGINYFGWKVHWCNRFDTVENGPKTVLGWRFAMVSIFHTGEDHDSPCGYDRNGVS